MCSFSWATGTSRVRHNADYVPCAQIRFDLSTSESRQPHHRLQWRIRDKSLWPDIWRKINAVAYYYYYEDAVPGSGCCLGMCT